MERTCNMNITSMQWMWIVCNTCDEILIITMSLTAEEQLKRND